MIFDAKFGDTGWAYDADGALCMPPPVRGDTETGVLVCSVRDEDGRPVADHEAGEMVTVVKKFKAPLTVVPLVYGTGPPATLAEYRRFEPCHVVESEGG